MVPLQLRPATRYSGSRKDLPRPPPLLGHRSIRSTEVYTQVLALDAAASEIGLSFSVANEGNPLLTG